MFNIKYGKQEDTTKFCKTKEDAILLKTPIIFNTQTVLIPTYKLPVSNMSAKDICRDNKEEVDAIYLNFVKYD
jgi:hypothetical protein